MLLDTVNAGMLMHCCPQCPQSYKIVPDTTGGFGVSSTNVVQLPTFITPFAPDTMTVPPFGNVWVNLTTVAYAAVVTTMLRITAATFQDFNWFLMGLKSHSRYKDSPGG